MKSFLKTTADSPIRAFLFFLTIGLLLYGVVLNAPFKTLDDLHSIVQNPLIRDFSHIKEIFTTSFFEQNSYYRPLVTLSFAIEYQFFKLSSFFYNLNNVLLHVANTCLVFCIIRLFAQISSLALLTSVVFLVHPLQAEAVGNVPGRAIVLGTFFTLLCVYFFLLRIKNKLSFGHYLASIALFAGSLLCKESSVVTPGLIASYLFFYRKEYNLKLLQILKLLMPYAGVLVVYFWWRNQIGITNVARWESLSEQLLGITTFFYALLIYIKNIILPSGLYYDHSTLLISGFSDKRMIVTLVIWISISVLLIRGYKKLNPLVSFWLSWIAINLITVSQIVPIKVADQYISTADHFIYVASIGVFMLGGFYGYQLFNLLIAIESVKRSVVKFIIGCWVVLLMMVTLQLNFYASQEIAMFKRSLQMNPANNRVRNSLAVSYANARQFEKTESLYRESLRLKPDDTNAGVGLATSLADQGRLWEALEAYERVTTATGSVKKVRDSNIQQALNQLEMQFKKRLNNDSTNAQLHYSLGVVYFKKQLFDQAIQSFKQALVLKPDYDVAAYNLASTLHELNQLSEAKKYYQILINLNQADPNLINEAQRRLQLIP